MAEPAFAKRFSVVLVICGTLAAGLWTLMSSVIAGFDEECAYRPGGCDHTPS